MLIQLISLYFLGVSTPAYSQVSKSSARDGTVRHYQCQKWTLKVRSKLEKPKFVSGVHSPADKNAMSEEDIYRVDFTVNDKLGVSFTKPSWLLTSMLSYTSTRTGESETKTRILDQGYAKRQDLTPGLKVSTGFETAQTDVHGKVGKKIKGTAETTVSKGSPTKWKNENLETFLVTEITKDESDGTVRKMEQIYAPKIDAALKLTRFVGDKIEDECSLTSIKRL